jgi:hypothetical protein
MFMDVCTYVCVLMCMNLYICICVYVYIYVYHIYICIHVYMYVYVSIYAMTRRLGCIVVCNMYHNNRHNYTAYTH